MLPGKISAISYVCRLLPLGDGARFLVLEECERGEVEARLSDLVVEVADLLDEALRAGLVSAS